MLNRYEIEHFIQPGTLAGLGWSEELHDNRPALRFTTATGPRWRFSDGEKPKYDQNVGYVACWYGLKRAADNARLWGLDCIVDCNGAASTIAADQHRVPAFSLQSGEGARPKPELIAELKSVWSGKVIVAFDCDEAGRAGAIKRVQVYRESGIEAEAVDLGLPIDGGDLADFVGRYPGTPIDGLRQCERLIIPEPTKPRTKEYDRASFAGWNAALEEIKQRLSCYDFMLQRYGEPKKRGRRHGHWLAIQRTEDNASFCAYMDAGGWYDYGSDEGGDIFDLIELVENRTFTEAARLAAGLANVSLPERSEINAAQNQEYFDAKIDWSGKLSTGERGAMYRFLDPSCAALIEMWITSGCERELVDVEFLNCIGENVGLTERKIRSALKRLPVVFLTFEDSIISIREEYHDSLSSDCVLELRARKIGRPAQLYRFADRATFRSELVKLAIPQIIKEVFPKKNNQLQLAPPIHAAFLEELGLDEDEARVRAAELEARYGAELKAQPGWREAMQEVRKRVRDLKAQLLSTDYAPLPTDATLDNRPNMLAAAMRALMEFLGGAFQMGRAKLCALIGCRDKELAGVCRNAGIAIDKNAYALRPVVNLPDLLAIPHKFDAKMGGFPVDVQSTLDKRPMHLDSPNLERWAIKQIIGQAKLTVRYRLANRYKLAEPEPVVAPIELPVPAKSLAVQQPLFAPPYSPRDTFLPYWRALVVFQFSARLLNALVMAYEVAKGVAWHARQSAEKVVKYGEALVNKLVDLATPWQRRGDTLLDRSTGEVKTASLQLSLDLLLARQEHNLVSTKDSEAPVGMKVPEESLELPSGSGSDWSPEPCRSLPLKSSGSTIGIGSEVGPPKTTPALAISLSP